MIEIEQTLSQTVDSSSEGSKSPRDRIGLRPCQQLSYTEPDTCSSNESEGNGNSSGGNGDESSGSKNEEHEEVSYCYEFGFLSLFRLMKVT